MSLSFSMEASGNFDKTLSWIEKMRARKNIPAILNKYGSAGVAALRSATPVQSGATAASWGYTVTKTGGGYQIAWTNSNINNGVPIALIIQTGHGTGTGGWVQGRDYINPAVGPIMDRIAKAIELELRS